MKNSSFIKSGFVVFAVFLAQVSAFADTKEVGKARDFVNYCGTGRNYKSCDDIVLTANIELTSDITLRKNLRIRSKSGGRYTISVANARQFAIDPGYTLSLENIIFDGKNYSRRNEGLFYLNESSNADKIARLELNSGATIRNVTVTTTADADHAVIHAKKGSRVIIHEGAEILNCHNKSAHGNGGAICCDSGNIFMTGGVIAGCSAKGSGGAIRVTGARNSAEDHLGAAMRGDIFLYGGYITNNVCGEGSAAGAKCYGGGIYLGDTGPMLHVIGPVVVSNNVCKVRNSGSSTYKIIADDVSTFELKDEYANRLKLSDDESGLRFANGWVGVRYPDLSHITEEAEIEKEIKTKRFGGLWEYDTTYHEESRQFFWNGDNRYRGWISGNALIWTRHKIYQLPFDRTTVKDVLQTADTNFPVFIEFNDGFIMNKDAYGDSHIRVPNGLVVTFDLQGHSITCNLEVANGGRVVFCDSSTNRSGKVWGYRDVASDIVKDSPAYTNAYRIEGGSYRTKPDPAWVAEDRVVVGNYCEVHPWMVARLAWETNLTSNVADITLVPLEEVDNEVRDIIDVDDIEEITYSTGDWVLNAHTNANRHVRVLAAPAVLNADSGDFEEVGSRIVYFDTAKGGVVDHDNIEMPFNAPVVLPLNDANSGNAASYGREDTFIWNAKSFDLVKLIHITYEKTGSIERTNAVEQAYFRFPPAELTATQRKTNGKLPITIVDQLLSKLDYNRAKGFSSHNVSATLDEFEANGLRKWENIVTGTSEDHLLVSSVEESENATVLKVSMTEPDKVHRDDTGYSVFYDLKKSTDNGWVRIGDVKTKPDFSVELTDADGKSQGASGFYRVTTLIVPNDTLAITNEIPSTNIIGVLEVASSFTNTMTAVPWVALSRGATELSREMLTVSEYLHTPQLDDEDLVRVADNGYIYQGWSWNVAKKKWEGLPTATKKEVVLPEDPESHLLSRNSATWVTRSNPSQKPFFIVGEYSSEDISLTVDAGTENEPICTLVPNPSLKAANINEDYDWGDKPHAFDLIRIPNEKKAPQLLLWNPSAKKWEGWITSENGISTLSTDFTVPAGQGFWYHRCDGAFELTLPVSVPAED